MSSNLPPPSPTSSPPPIPTSLTDLLSLFPSSSSLPRNLTHGPPRPPPGNPNTTPRLTASGFTIPKPPQSSSIHPSTIIHLILSTFYFLLTIHLLITFRRHPRPPRRLTKYLRLAVLLQNFTALFEIIRFSLILSKTKVPTAYLYEPEFTTQGAWGGAEIIMCGLIWGIFRSVVERQKRELKEIGYLLRDDGWKRGLKRWGFSAWVNLGFWGLVGAVYVAVTGLRIVVVQVGVTMMTLGAGISGGEKTKEEVANRLKELVRRRNEVYWDAGVLTIVADALVVAGVVAYGLWGMWLRKDIGRGGSASYRTVRIATLFILPPLLLMRVTYLFGHAYFTPWDVVRDPLFWKSEHYHPMPVWWPAVQKAFVYVWTYVMVFGLDKCILLELKLDEERKEREKLEVEGAGGGWELQSPSGSFGQGFGHHVRTDSGRRACGCECDCGRIMRLESTGGGVGLRPWERVRDRERELPYSWGAPLRRF